MNTLEGGLLAFWYCWLAYYASAYPLYISANGSVVLTSAFGGNLTLRPKDGGAVVASSLISAQGGVALNNTLLTEQLISGLLSTSATLAERVVQLEQAIALPPACLPPGGAALQFNGTNWTCACNHGWVGTSCTVLLYYQVNLTSCDALRGYPPTLNGCQSVQTINSGFSFSDLSISFGFAPRPGASDTTLWQRVALPRG